MNKKYIYPYINHNSKKINYVVVINNKLYFPEKDTYRFNYIILIKSSFPKIDGYKCVIKNFNNNKYMHYTNEFISKNILVDFKNRTYNR